MIKINKAGDTYCECWKWGKQMEKKIMRGDIFYADLGTAIGSEQGGVRPVLIIQNNVGNKYSPTVIIAAITGSKKAEIPTHVMFPKYSSLKSKSTVLLEQIRTIDKSRLRRYIGNTSVRTKKKIEQALAVSVGIQKRKHR